MYEEDQKKSGVVGKVEKRVMANAQVESGFSGICWWHLGYWDKMLGLQVKKEEPLTPLLNIKVESPPILNLQYPSQSPTTPSSCYHSLDPNDFENWGYLATT